MRSGGPVGPPFGNFACAPIAAKWNSRKMAILDSMPCSTWPGTKQHRMTISEYFQ